MVNSEWSMLSMVYGQWSKVKSENFEHLELLKPLELLEPFKPFKPL